MKHRPLNTERTRLREHQKRNVDGVHERVLVVFFEFSQRKDRARRARNRIDEAPDEIFHLGHRQLLLDAKLRPRLANHLELFDR